MNINMTGFRWFSKISASLYLDESQLSIDIFFEKKIRIDHEFTTYFKEICCLYSDQKFSLNFLK